jgi:hypothetical protein
MSNGNVFKGRWGYHACDYSTFRLLKQLHKLVLQARIIQRDYERWERKDPKNRRRRVRDREFAVTGPKVNVPKGLREWEPMPAPYKTIVDPAKWSLVVSQYRIARIPWKHSSQVIPLVITYQEAGKHLLEMAEWYRNMRTYNTANDIMKKYLL